MKRRKAPITGLQRKLIAKLLQGYFLRRFRRGDRSWYVLYDQKVNPIEKVNCRVVDKMDRFLPREIELWKRDKHGNLSLNLSMVRRIDGRNPIKKMYKRREELANNEPIHQRRTKKTKSTNEKGSLLF